MSDFTRRENLKHLSGLGAVIIGGGAGLPAPVHADDASGLIAKENAKPGTRDWMLARPKVDASNRCPWIEGYCSRTSVMAGEALTFHVSTRPAASFVMDIYRLGFYGGDGGRLMTTLGPFQGIANSEPAVGEKRARICDWPVAASITIPDDWLSGVYVGKLTEQSDGIQSYVIFIVRDQRKADFLYHCSDNTWQAYNRWPSTFSLYDEHEWFWGGGVQVSYRRPYGKYRQILDAPLSTGSGEFFLWEFPLVFWMESLGYDVSYISNIDTHRDGAGLLRGKGLLSVGHDEYWSIEMFNNVRDAVAKGVSVGFFSGNAVCGRIVFDDSGHTYERVGVFGPPGGTHEFYLMKTLVHQRPYANELVGAHSTGPVTGGADWICALPEHWIYDGTGMKSGDSIPGVIGWEWHGDPAAIPGLEIVATGPTQGEPGVPNGGVYTATVYPGPKQNFVFNAATCWWADGLSEPPGYVRPKVYIEPKGPDARLQRITRNVLDRMLGK
ncbi:MAG: hypothetical protein O3C21_04005 [Verrucomicrobia bacterium]|nr:hypothetical protein [Verrucomicrobiota bacterium]